MQRLILLSGTSKMRKVIFIFILVLNSIMLFGEGYQGFPWLTSRDKIVASDKKYQFEKKYDHYEGLSMVGAGIHDGDIVLFDARMGLEPDDLYVFAWEKKVYCKLLKYNPLDFNLRVYSMHTTKVAEAELVRTINLNTTYDLENFNLFGRVLGWIHENRLVKHEQ